MCGRYTLSTSRKQLQDALPLFEVPEVAPRYNIAPSQNIMAARILPDGKREVALLRWGLIPSWADDPKIGYKMINARSETAASKPSFRAAYRKRRCLIPADGFYEWKKTNGKKIPFLIYLEDHKPFAFAGLWEHWEHEGENIESCTILTTSANDLVKPLHDRMPVILDPKDYLRWLDPDNQTGKGLEDLLQPFRADAMNVYEVSTRVNSPGHDDADCIEPVRKARRLFDE